MGSIARVILVPSIRDASHDSVFPQVVILMHQGYIYYMCDQFAYILRCYMLTVRSNIIFLVVQPAFDVHPPDLKHQVPDFVNLKQLIFRTSWHF